MSTWIIEPHDPLIFRDGKPFGPTPGAQASTLEFPFPSTIAGGFRYHAALDEHGMFQYSRDDVQQLNKLKKLAVRGPLLVQLEQLNVDQPTEGWMAPSPLDALALENEETENSLMLHQLVPLLLPEKALTDFASFNYQKLYPVGQPEHNPNKPAKDAPRYWHWQYFQDWLIDPARCTQKPIDARTLGLRGLQRELRVHNAMDASRHAAKDEVLFDTSGLEFTARGEKTQRISKAQRLALAVSIGDQTEFSIRDDLDTLGSERRIVSWRKSAHNFPKCPDEVANEVASSGKCRVILLTPAHFEAGYTPTWISEAVENVQPQLKAIAIARPHVVSGWDMAAQRRKATRRLAPAGTVLYLELDGTETDRRNWLEQTWMQNISDDEQARLDGFGLAVVGNWSGQPVAMKG